MDQADIFGGCVLKNEKLVFDADKTGYDISTLLIILRK